MRIALALFAVVLLVGCGQRDDDVGGVTPEEDRLLNEAAAAQDANLTSQPVGNADNADVGADTGNAQ